jgi:hypothetical protein
MNHTRRGFSDTFHFRIRRRLSSRDTVRVDNLTLVHVSVASAGVENQLRMRVVASLIYSDLKIY